MGTYKKKPMFRLVKQDDGQIRLRVKGANGELMLWNDPHENFEDIKKVIRAVIRGCNTHGTRFIWEDEDGNVIQDKKD